MKLGCQGPGPYTAARFMRDLDTRDVPSHALQVREEAAAYWWLRAALAPLTLLNMALSGILQVTAAMLRHSCLVQQTQLADQGLL